MHEEKEREVRIEAKRDRDRETKKLQRGGKKAGQRMTYPKPDLSKLPRPLDLHSMSTSSGRAGSKIDSITWTSKDLAWAGLISSPGSRMELRRDTHDTFLRLLI